MLLGPSDIDSVFAPKELVDALRESGMSHYSRSEYFWTDIAEELRSLAGKHSNFTNARTVHEEAELLYARYTGFSTENYELPSSYKTPELFIKYLIARGVPLKPYTGVTRVISVQKDAPPGGVTCTKCNMKNEWAAPNVGMAYLCYNCRVQL